MADKYVVLASLVLGKHQRGAVVTRGELDARQQDGLDRCLRLGAVRRATAEESALEYVDLGAPSDTHLLPPQGMRQVIVEQEAEIARLRERIIDLEALLSARVAQPA